MSGASARTGERDLLGRVIAGDVAAFALLHRPESRPGTAPVEVLAGPVSERPDLASLPLPAEGAGGGAAGDRHDLLAVVPYRQIGERGFAHVDDGAPLLALEVAEHSAVPLSEALERLPDIGIGMTGGAFDIPDAAYAATARRIIDDEIGRGEGANFVLKRTFTASLGGPVPRSALTLFRRLLERENGVYWTFVVHTPGRTFVGASPERHISLRGGGAVMNPISGTYRYPPEGPSLDGVLAFLADGKETDELYMVVDEELKMMARICDAAPRVVGPRLKEMARLAHTEYLIEGSSGRDPRDILRETLFAPTVTGSPLESACRVIARHEPEGRGHYSGALALIGRDAAGRRTLDSAILIRTADISPGGRLRVGVGSTLVRHSDPLSEVKETAAKAAGLIAALEDDPAASLSADRGVRTALARRNEGVSGFWLGDGAPAASPRLHGLRILVVDAEDSFTSMLAHQLRALGPRVEVRAHDEPHALDRHDVVVMGPGPGDPGDLGDPRIAAVAGTVRTLFASGRPFLAICLSHQLLCGLLGLDVVRRDAPNQGDRHVIDLFGRRERVGFYNTYEARCADDKFDAPGPRPGPVEVSRHGPAGGVHALRGPGFMSLQFHPESLLTCDGPGILARCLEHVLASGPHLPGVSGAGADR
ncbi:anthranilate synthase family protein [Nocardiopsis mangrovi]|uniref:anthranilate synthase n=1 Tax=Nocardiopsis mangrovi TaxID=1179818 RepID=A0ABV9DQ12_9ACTN